MPFGQNPSPGPKGAGAAKKYTGRGQFPDMIQAGNECLMQAVDGCFGSKFFEMTRNEG
jgi:hypothetical protein